MKKLLAKKKVGKVGTAQLKITGILIYYTILGVMGLVASTMSFTSYSTKTREGIAQYLFCENSGSSDCVLDSAAIGPVGILSIVVTVLFSFLPVVAILVSCDPRACKKKPKIATLSKKSSVISGMI